MDVYSMRAKKSLERGIGKCREHALPAGTRIRELRLLLRKVQPLDRHGFPSLHAIADDLVHALRDSRLRLMRRRIGKSQRDVERVDHVAEAVGFGQRNKADVEIDTDATRREVRAHGDFKRLGAWEDAPAFRIAREPPLSVSCERMFVYARVSGGQQFATLSSRRG
jgi:hypothetical protein